MHQDKDEQDLRAPIVSVSLGLPAIFQFGGLQRSDPLQRLLLEHGDVVVWGGESRLFYHGIQPLKAGIIRKRAIVVTISPSDRRVVASIKIRIILDVIGEPFKLLAVLLLRIACYGTSLSSGASIAGRFWALLLSACSAPRWVSA